MRDADGHGLSMSTNLPPGEIHIVERDAHVSERLISRERFPGRTKGDDEGAADINTDSKPCL